MLELFGWHVYNVFTHNTTLARVGLEAGKILGGSALASWDYDHYLGLFFHDPFLSGLDSGVVSVRRAHYRLVSAFSTPAESPRDKAWKIMFLEIVGLD